MSSAAARPSPGPDRGSPAPISPITAKERERAERERTPGPPSHPPPPQPRRTSSSSKPPLIPESTPPPSSPSAAARAKSPGAPSALPPPSSPSDKDKVAAPAERLSKSAVSTPTKETPPEPPRKEEIINMETFGQILEMDDDDEDREFSKSIVYNFFDQASATLVKMETAIEKRDLENLASLGHFLKGSSGALGIDKVQHSCERMQHYGQLRDEEKGADLDADTALEMIRSLHVGLKDEYAEAEKWLRKYFEG